MFMSDYQFETDKIENAPRTQGDGGHLEEVQSWLDSIHDSIQIYSLKYVKS